MTLYTVAHDGPEVWLESLSDARDAFDATTGDAILFRVETADKGSTELLLAALNGFGFEARRTPIHGKLNPDSDTAF